MLKVNQKALQQAGAQLAAARSTVDEFEKETGITGTPDMVMGELRYQQSGAHSFNENSAASWEAGIWDETEGKERDEYYSALDQLYNDPRSALYNPYRKATNTQFTDPLKKYGLDVPEIITADWITEQLNQYRDALPKNTSGEGVSLPKRHTKEQAIAYNLYQLNALEYDTQKAEKELDDIRRTVTWYAQHGYSQDDVAKVVAKMKHPTLDSLAITRDPSQISFIDDDGYKISTKQGTAVQLNRSVYFDDDILTGMYWKALNGADDIDDFAGAVYAYQNKGKVVGGSRRQQEMRTYGSPNYQPYADGCTDIDAKMMFGQDEFTYQDIQRLMQEAQAEGDDSKVAALKKLYKAETDTANAEKELASLQDWVSRYDFSKVEIPEGQTPEEFFQKKLDSRVKTDSGNYKTLAQMDKDRDIGLPMSLNRSVNYRKEDMLDEMVTRYNAAHGITSDPKKTLGETTGGTDFGKPPVKPAEEGNIDIDNRQVVHNDDGSISTERSFSVEIDGMEVLLPTVINGKIVSEDEAINHYLQTGEHLGKFKTPEEANEYAEWLHERQEKRYGEQPEQEETPVKEEASKDDEYYTVNIMGKNEKIPAYRDGKHLTKEEALAYYTEHSGEMSTGSVEQPEAKPAPERKMQNYETRDDQEMQDWLQSHPQTDSFNPNYVMMKPGARAGTTAAGGAYSDVMPMKFKPKQTTYQVTDKEGAVEFTESDLRSIMQRAYSGSDSLTDEEKRMGNNLIKSIPWAFGDTLQWLGTDGEFDSGAMRRMDATASALGDDLRAIRDATEGFYATSGEKADVSVQLFVDSMTAAANNMTIAEWYERTEEGQERKQELMGILGGITQREDEINAENEARRKAESQMMLAGNMALLNAADDPDMRGTLTEEDLAAADALSLHPGEADDILGSGPDKDTWDKAREDLSNALWDRFYSVQEQTGGDTAAAIRDLFGLADDADISELGINANDIFTEMDGIVDIAKQFYAQDAKLASMSGMTLEEYYEAVGERKPEDLFHAAFQYRQLMNGEDSISEEAKQGIGILGTVWNGMKLGAVDVAAGDIGFLTDMTDLLISPGDRESLTNRYNIRYGFFDGRNQYRDDVNTMLAWWEGQEDPESQEKARTYKEKMRMLDENGLDIFNLGFNPDSDQLERIRKQVEDELRETEAWIDQYATDAEKHGVKIIRSATGSMLQQSRAIAISAVTGLPAGLMSTLSFLPGSFEGHLQDTEGRGWDDTRRYMYAMIGGLMDAAMEGEITSKFYNFGGDAAAGWLSKTATEFAAKHGITGLGSHLVYGLMVYGGNSVGEISQEILQNVAGGIYDYLWTGDNTMLRDAVARDTMIDTILSTALSTFMSTTAYQGAAAARGAPSMFSNRYRITTAAMLEFSPELREAAQELFNAGQLYDKSGNIIELVTENARNAAAERAEEIQTPLPVRPAEATVPTVEETSARAVNADEMAQAEQGPAIPEQISAEDILNEAEQPEAPAPEPNQVNADNSARAITEEEQRQAEQGPAIPEAPAEAPAPEPKQVNAENSARAVTEEAQTQEEQGPTVPEQAQQEEAPQMSPELSMFVEKAKAWFGSANAQLRELTARAADQNVSEEDKAALEHSIETVRRRINEAYYEAANRLTKMDIKIKLAELMKNPEAIADMVKFTASQQVSSKIAAGALTAKPSTKGKLREKLESARAADEANKAAEAADKAAQQAGTEVTEARTANRENPSPENAKREVNAVKKKMQADKEADQARKTAEKANTEAQKKEEDLNKDLASNLEQLRTEATEDATAKVQQLQQAVGESLEADLEVDSPSQMEFPVVNEVTSEEVAETTEETKRDVAETIEAEQAKQEAETQPKQENLGLKARLDDLKQRLTNLNTDGKKKITGNRYVIPAMVEAASADANVENYISSLDDAGLQNLLREAKSAGLKKSNTAAWLRGVARRVAEQNGQTLQADAFTEAKDRLTEVRNATATLKAVPAAQLFEPAQTVQTVLAEQIQQMEALKNQLDSERAAHQPTADILSQVMALRQEMVTTMDTAGIVLRAWNGDTSHSGFTPDTYAELNNKAKDARERILSYNANMEYKSAETAANEARTQEDSIDAAANLLLQDINKLVNNGGKVIPVNPRAATDTLKDYRLPGVGTDRRGAATGATTPGAFNPPTRSPIEIFQKLGSDLGIGTYSSIKNMPKGHDVPATTDPRRGYILTARHHSNDAWVLYHEIGHNIQERTKTATTQDMINGMDPATRAQYTGQQLNDEAYAEFVASYVSGTANAYYAPNTVTDFENALRKSGIYNKVQEAKNAQAAYNLATPIERIGAHTKYENHRDERPTANSQAFADLIRKTGIGMVDDTMAAARFDKASGLSRSNTKLSIQEQAKLMKGDAQRATNLIVNQLRTLGGSYIREGFAEATEGFSESQLHLLDSFEVAVHALDRAKLALKQAEERVNYGVPTNQWRPLSNAEIQEALEKAQVLNSEYNSLQSIKDAVYDVMQNHPEIVAAHEQRASWWKDFMQEYAVNTHLLTQEEMDTLNRDYPNYAPMYRVGKEGASLFKQLTGSDRDVIAPTEGYVHNINKIVEQGRRNAVLESIYNEITSDQGGDGLGLFVRVADGKEDANTVKFTDGRGEEHFLQFEDKELFDMITSSATPKQAHGALKGVAKLTRAMAMFTTGSNPLFAAKNFIRDFQQGVNHGSWAATYIDGAVKWIIAGLEMAGSQMSDTKLAEKLHLDNVLSKADIHGHAAEYRALHGSDDYTHHGLPRSTKDADNLLAMFTDDAKSKPKNLWDNVWNVVTFNGVNGWVEQTTRYAEYLFGKHDLSTEVGRQKAYLAAQESTTNFALSGKSEWAADLRAMIPFFNATLQGTYSALHSFSDAERDRLPARLTKTIVNNVLMGVLAYKLLDKYGSDDDKKWYEKLADGIKMDNIILPLGGLEKLFGQEEGSHSRQFLRIPLTQNPFGKLFYNVGRIMMHDKIGGESLMDLGSVAMAILSEATQTDPITNPLINAIMNKTYYGSNIVPNYLLETYDGQKIPNVEHMNDSTAGFFGVIARFNDTIGLDNGVLDDPMKLQYLFQQYTGFIGKLLIPLATGTRATGYNTGMGEFVYNVGNIIYKDWTVDAAYSNDINDAFHDYKEEIGSIAGSAKNFGRAAGLNQTLSVEEQQEAVDVAAYLTGSTGPLTKLGKEISELYKQQEAVYSDESLSYEDRNTKARDIQKMIVEKQAEGLGICKEYASKYMGQTFSKDYILYGAKGGLNQNPAYGFPVITQATRDGDHPGLNKALEVYKEVDGIGGMSSSDYNPSPYTTVKLTTHNSVPLYGMETACAEQYQQTFLDTFEDAMEEAVADWDNLSTEERRSAVKSAISAAKKESRQFVLDYYEQNGMMPEDNED